MTQAHSAMPTAAQWRKSSYSGGGNQCVEVAQLGDTVGVRDSKTPSAGHLAFGAGDWRAFLDGVKRGSYDL